MINNSLKVLWEKTLGVLPADEQFAIWEELHSPETIRKAILKTAMKNQGMNGQMTPEHRLRFASKVMSTLTAQDVEHAKNREALQREFGRPEGISGERLSSGRLRSLQACDGSWSETASIVVASLKFELDQSDVDLGEVEVVEEEATEADASGAA